MVMVIIIVVVIVIVMNKGERWLMSRHSTGNDSCQDIPSALPGQLPTVYLLNILRYGIPWLVQFTCPGHDPSQLLVPLLPGRAKEIEKSLIQSKHHSAKPKTSVCYQHISHPKFKSSIPAETRIIVIINNCLHFY